MKMRMRHPIALIVLVCATLLSARPALAQFSQQGPKLVGTGAVGSASQGTPCPSPPTATRPSSEGPPTTVAGAAWVWTRSGGVWTQQGPKLVGSGAVGAAATRLLRVPLRRRQHGHRRRARATTATLGPRGSGRGAEASGPSRDPSWSARAPWGTLAKASPCPSPPTATRPSSEGSATTVALEPRGSGRGAEASGPSRAPSWSARAPWGTLTKAVPCPSPPTATRPSSEGTTTTVALGPRGSGRGAEASGPSRDPSWSARAPWGTPNKAGPCPSPPTATRPSSEGPATVGVGAAWVWTRSGGVWTQQGPKLVGSGAVGNAQQGYSVSLSADGNTAIVGGPIDNSQRWGRVGLDEERRQSGPSRDPSWSARAPWGALTKASPCPSPPTATRPSSEGGPTTVALGPRGSGPRPRRQQSRRSLQIRR